MDLLPSCDADVEKTPGVVFTADGCEAAAAAAACALGFAITATRGAAVLDLLEAGLRTRMKEGMPSP